MKDLFLKLIETFHSVTENDKTLIICCCFCFGMWAMFTKQPGNDELVKNIIAGLFGIAVGRSKNGS